MFTFLFTDVERMECLLGDVYECVADCAEDTKRAAATLCEGHINRTFHEKKDGYVVCEAGKVIAAFVYCTIKMGFEK